jgi:hypothetical protein
MTPHCARGIGLGALLCALGAPLDADATELSGSLRAGLEYDSNPLRRFESAPDAGEGSGAGGVEVVPQAIETDVAAKVSGAVDAAWEVSETSEARLQARAGLRKLLEYDSEDALVWQAAASQSWLAGDRWSHRIELDGKGRLERAARRDYARAGGRWVAAWSHADWTLESSLGFSAFAYLPDPDLGWTGPAAQVEAIWAPSEAWELRASYGPSLRLSPDGAGEPSHAAQLRAQWLTGPLLLEGGYAFVRSESSAVRYQHQVVDLSVGALLFESTMLRARGMIQRTTYPSSVDLASVDDAAAPELAVEDENRNQVSVSLEQPLGAGLSLETRYAGLFQSLATPGDDRTFARHIGYVGLAWTWRAGQGDDEEPR